MRTFFLLFTLAGCTATTSETRLVLRDPSEVAIEAGPDHEVVLPRGHEPHSAVIDEGRMSTGEDSAADYRVSAVRDPDGTLALRWETRLALSDGELQLLWPKDGTFSTPGEAKELVPVGDQLRLEQCALLSRNRGRRGSYTGTFSYMRLIRRLPDPLTCSRDAGEISYTLTTPWSNVVEIRQKTTSTWRGLGWLMLPLDLAVAGPGIWLAATAGPTSRRVGGGALIGLAILLQAPLIPAMAKRARVVVLPVPMTAMP